MRCHICDRVLDEPKFNKDTDAYEPCEPCMVIILDAAGSFVDRPYADEEDFGEDPVVTSFWETVLVSPDRPDDP